jgi:hypothetical protein
MSLTTPDKIRTLQRKLYLKAQTSRKRGRSLIAASISFTTRSGEPTSSPTPTAKPARMRVRRVWTA